MHVQKLASISNQDKAHVLRSIMALKVFIFQKSHSSLLCPWKKVQSCSGERQGPAITLSSHQSSRFLALETPCRCWKEGRDRKEEEKLNGYV